MKRQNFSSKRSAIINAIQSTDTHPSAAWVYETLKDEYPNLSLGTVYRNIALFKEQGIVVSVANVDGEERIDGNTMPHAHFVCKQCKNVYDIFNTSLSGVDKELSESGYNVDAVSLTFYGTCADCKK